MKVIERIVKKLSQKEKQEIKEAVEKNNISAKKRMYDSSALPFLFLKWKRYFPQSPQNINCKSCRKAVSKFWRMVAECIEEKEKKHITRTGALSPDAGSTL